MEVVGECTSCGKTVYCQAGFLQGIHENGQLLCFSCAEEQQKPSQPETED